MPPPAAATHNVCAMAVMLTTRKEGAPSAHGRVPLAAASAGLLRRMVQYQYFYVLLLPALLFYFVFNYIPIYGIVLAFKHYRFNTVGALGSLPVLAYIGQFMNMKWVGLQWFELLWGRPDFWRAFSNTLVISFLRLLFGFPAPIILALLINEVRRGGIKRLYQTVYTFPHFLSWVLGAGVLFGVLGTNGVLNQIIVELGGERIIFLIEPALFRGLLVGTEIWKSAGWGSIIFLAAIAGIDPQLYEAATIDGAGRWKSLMHITWPGIKTTAVILLILQVGNILNAGFDQIFNMYNPAVLPVSDIIDTYVFRMSFQEPKNFGFTTAVGLFKSVINFALLMAANWGARLLGERGLF